MHLHLRELVMLLMDVSIATRLLVVSPILILWKVMQRPCSFRDTSSHMNVSLLAGSAMAASLGTSQLRVSLVNSLLCM